ncbi:TonB-dependent receptor [Opitutus sp. GAS368]|uniref:TonB-dependent receptor n=1 Tax=Opitutus sp. GAS368 TaxID=1882749 RepID=UPI00087C8159|nr:TonB-dependent receptor [Opitutus sp. GAS368]SDS02687.1 iron complex outermembrane recepter protein [Opitutus sp. GAS368]
MKPTTSHTRLNLTLLCRLTASLLSSALITSALADDAGGGSAIRLEDLEVTAPRTSAQTMAPTESRLDAYQPQSIINLQTIQNSITPTADYALIANLAPSVSNFTTNGPGLNESKPIVRGFTDGQYNVTFDGIPFGDGNDYTHHTTSYFPAKILGRVVVDRGPGDASTIGMATFGGTIALFSKDPRAEPSFTPTLSDGSYHTRLVNLEVNTGTLAGAHNASLIASYQNMSTDGYRTLGTLKRNTYFLKYLQPVGKNTTVTVYGSYNNILFNNPNAATLTLTQIQTLGRNFGQDNDPTDFNNYVGYSYQSKQTDLEYIALDSDLGNGWKVSDKLYTFSYNNFSHESPNNNSGPAKTDLGGQFKVNIVRSLGDYLLLSHEDDMGTVKAGVWGDYQHGPRYNYFLDYNPAANTGPIMRGGMIDLNHKNSVGGYAWNMKFYTRTVQPFVLYDWRALPALTITPGLKYLSVSREIAASVNQTKDLLPAYFTKKWTKTLPSVTANYRVASDWSVYAQYAKGLLTPALATLQVDHPETTDIPPQETTNYQIGTVYKHGRFNADFDAYWIDFVHFPITQQNPANPTNANDVIYTTASGAYYSGLETEVTYYVGGGLSLFGNGSLNRAVYKKSKRQIDGVPQSTAGFGAVYDRAGFSVSLMEKYIGPYNVYSGAPSPDLPLPPTALTAVQGGYSLVDLAIGYGSKLPGHGFLHSYKVKLQVDNILDRKVELLKSVNANPLNSTYNVLVPRDYYLTVSAEF